MASKHFDRCPSCRKSLPLGALACPFCGWSKNAKPPQAPPVIGSPQRPPASAQSNAVVIAIIGVALVVSAFAFVSSVKPRDPAPPENAYRAPTKSAEEIARANQERQDRERAEAEKEFRIAEMVRTGIYSTDQGEFSEALRREGAPPVSPWDGLFEPAHAWLRANAHDPGSIQVSQVSKPIRVDGSQGTWYKQGATVRAKNGLGATVAQRYLFTVWKNGEARGDAIN